MLQDKSKLGVYLPTLTAQCYTELPSQIALKFNPSDTHLAQAALPCWLYLTHLGAPNPGPHCVPGRTRSSWHRLAAAQPAALLMVIPVEQWTTSKDNPSLHFISLSITIAPYAVLRQTSTLFYLSCWSMWHLLFTSKTSCYFFSIIQCLRPELENYWRTAKPCSRTD